jgi:hypothetical protein
MSVSSSPVGLVRELEPSATYVSKTDLIDWVNGLLQLQLTKLEQVGRRRAARDAAAPARTRVHGAAAARVQRRVRPAPACMHCKGRRVPPTAK